MHRKKRYRRTLYVAASSRLSVVFEEGGGGGGVKYQKHLCQPVLKLARGVLFAEHNRLLPGNKQQNV